MVLPVFRRNKPGFFVTGTDTGVGKTVVSCALVKVLREGGARVGVCKPLASGCEAGPGGGLVSGDAVALRAAAGCGLALEDVHPVRYAEPLAPGVAAEVSGRPVDWGAVVGAVERIDAWADVVVMEGVGGLMVPLDEGHTVLDLIVAMGYPVVVVTRAGLGTLNHTAMTVRLLREAGCGIVGLVVNGGASGGDIELGAVEDLSVETNPRWMERMNGVKVLARLPSARVGGGEMEMGLEMGLRRGEVPEEILGPMRGVDWLGALKAMKGDAR